MKKFITTLALVSTFAIAGMANAQSTSTTSVTPTGGSVVPSTSVTPTTGTTNDTTGSVTSTTTTGSVTDTSVGVPNTGLGGDASTTYAVLAISAAIAILAAAYALRSRKTL